MSLHQESVCLQGHIIDSLVLAKVLDRIHMMGGTFDLEDVHIGKTREEPSRARIVIRATSKAQLDDILKAIQPHGASVQGEADCRTADAPSNGIFPDDFYATTHLPTEVRLRGQWVDVDRIEMHARGITLEPFGHGRTLIERQPAGAWKYIPAW